MLLTARRGFFDAEALVPQFRLVLTLLSQTTLYCSLGIDLAQAQEPKASNNATTERSDLIESSTGFKQRTRAVRVDF